MEGTNEEGTANLVNNLVNNGTIKSNDASKATASQIDELVQRTTRGGLNIGDGTEKIRRIFNSELLTNKLTSNELKNKQEKSISLLKELLLIANDRYEVGADGESPPELMGFIVTGSLFNPDKVPTKGSDIEFAYPLKPDEVFKPADPNEMHGSDFWKYSTNRGILYVGSLPTPDGILKDGEATAYLRDYLSSPELGSLRKDFTQKEELKL